MIYRFGEFVLDTAAYVLRSHGRDVHLSTKGMELLVFLIENRPRAVTKQEIQDRIWPETFVVEASLPVLVREIRNAIGDDGREMIRTVHRRGYAFDCDVRESADGSERPRGSAHYLLVDDRVNPLGPGENIVGRDPDAAVSLPWTTVSRHHAIVNVDGDVATVVDLGSKNGTRVAGLPIREPTRLADGVEIHFGKVAVVYRFGDWDGATASMLDSIEA